MSKSSIASGFVFAAANILAGALNYSFNLTAGHQMDLLAFGSFNTWVAYVSVFQVSATFSLFLSNFHWNHRKTIVFHVLGVNVLGLLSLLGYYYSGKPLLAGVAAVVLAATSSWVVGQLQIRTLFSLIGGIVAMTAVFKLGFAVLGDGPKSFYWSLAVSPLPSFLLLLVYLWRRPPEAPPATIAIAPLSSAAISALLLSFSFAFIPQMDILFVHWTKSPEIVGQFAYVSLIYKAVFFGLSIFAQWLLPHQIRAAQMGSAKLSFVCSRWFVPGVLIVAGGVSAAALAFAPLLQHLSTEISVDNLRSWIVFSSFNMTLLAANFLILQSYAAGRRAQPAAICLALLIGALVIGLLMNLSIERYFTVVIFANLAALVSVSRRRIFLPSQQPAAVDPESSLDKPAKTGSL